MTDPLTPEQLQRDEDLAAAQETIGTLQLTPFDPTVPRGLDGLGDALKGLLQPSAGAGRALLLAGAPVAQGLDALANAGPSGEQRSPTAFQDAYFRAVDDIGTNATDYWRPDPQSMGAAARAISVGANLVGTVPQIVGAPSLFLGDAALNQPAELVHQGVDAGTAEAVGAVNLALNAAGLRLPAAIGKSLATRVATGAGANLALGAGADAASAAALRRGGYDEQAKAYDATDPWARGLDLLLGSAFGVHAHLTAPRAPLAQRDAVLAARNADHFERRTMPGEPLAPGADVRHQQTLEEAIGQLLRGDRVDIAASVRPEDFAAAPALDAVGDALAPAPTAETSYDAFRQALESGGRADAANPRSSAVGVDQFTAGTWRSVVAIAQPAWAEGLTERQILDARKDPAKSAEMEQVLREQNAAALRSAGVPVDNVTLYAAHHFGSKRAVAFARAADDVPMDQLLSKGQLDANPYLRGKTKGETVANWERRAGVATDAQAARTAGQPGGEAAPAAPDIHIVDGFDADGAPRYRPLSEAMAEVDADHRRAVTDAKAYQAAADCFLRRGG